MAKFLTPVFRDSFKRRYKKLPVKIQEKFLKQLGYLTKDYRHPSLRTRKMSNSGIFEARLDFHNRFTFEVSEDEIILRTIGPHDEGLGKK
jgi:mRNA interferase RelE/StbE